MKKLSNLFLGFLDICLSIGLILVAVSDFAEHRQFRALLATFLLLVLIVIAVMDFRVLKGKKFKLLCDFLWVFQAFLRGKVLRQKAYKPICNTFCPPVNTTAKRILMLIKWWRRRPMKIADLYSCFQEQLDGKGDSFKMDDKANISFVRDTGDVTHVVSICLRDNLWHISTFKVNEWQWHADDLFFAR